MMLYLTDVATGIVDEGHSTAAHSCSSKANTEGYEANMQSTTDEFSEAEVGSLPGLDKNCLFLSGSI